MHNLENVILGTSLVVQWQKLCTLNAGDWIGSWSDK